MKKTLKQIQKSILNQMDFENGLMSLKDVLKCIDTNKITICYCNKEKVNFFSVLDKKKKNHYYINFHVMKIRKNHKDIDINQLNYCELNLVYNSFKHFYQQELKSNYLDTIHNIKSLHNNLLFKIEFNKFNSISKKCKNNMKGFF
ncbi:MAG: hypothetical protein PVG30_02060 [Gammaproteobacteria bacterium]|jgi:hypothetical protein